MGRQTIEILGVSVNPITLAQALRAIDEMAQDDQNHYIVTPNPEMVMYARTCPEFRETLNRASLSLVDGFGLLWAAKYLSLPLTTISGLRDIQEFWQFIWTSAAIVLAPKALDIIPERLTGADMVWEIAKLASERDQSIFLLGGQPGVASTAGSLLQQMYPRLRLAGAVAGQPYDDTVTVLRNISTSRPKFVLLALPADQQMDWLETELPKLSGAVAMGVGGALDFIAGTTALNAPTATSPAKRAPEWWQRHGLEWLWRFMIQPWRRQRIKIATIDFMRAVRYDKLNNK
ncbi:TPA: hypothetical protein DHW58_02155 [Patescibacteria group bacterium]|uniref:Glycosyl transferase, WecB/TagA/CpsF family n=2 Tax=Bacteria division Kazan-3B-28 TaxID=1798534 RepID=A0A0G1X714_UNCK3|nr:MAG: anti-sigma-factor antagonist and glycosyl transferase [candidate division Kazan bacterium GW2011_GWA1_50_15]KKW25460.1 MAG: Glycosyl transferase, WecB/TagA/CpsF family [candidate division Kazan bacterium GW2011_GWC1_52_13]KKW26766.1 MAG: Glycosyl transferase, WecB/TagA/CpsF family [candidate division Kazan bacterium GW2011_GWB1_52_7]HAV65762.1 hypothetical protein [Patescibacteria group bacterium]HCL47772.1 hypothetical protein [Patescibacteria group bacterium]